MTNRWELYLEMMKLSLKFCGSKSGFVELMDQQREVALICKVENPEISQSIREMCKKTKENLDKNPDPCKFYIQHTAIAGKNDTGSV